VLPVAAPSADTRLLTPRAARLRSTNADIGCPATSGAGTAPRVTMPAMHTGLATPGTDDSTGTKSPGVRNGGTAPDGLA